MTHHLFVGMYVWIHTLPVLLCQGCRIAGISHNFHEWPLKFVFCKLYTGVPMGFEIPAFSTNYKSYQQIRKIEGRKPLQNRLWWPLLHLRLAPVKLISTNTDLFLCLPWFWLSDPFPLPNVNVFSHLGKKKLFCFCFAVNYESLSFVWLAVLHFTPIVFIFFIIL